MKPKKYVLMNDYDYEYKVIENDGDFSLEYLLNDYIWEFIERWKINSMCQYVIKTLEKSEKEVKKLMQTTDHHTIMFIIKEDYKYSKWDVYKKY